MAIKLLLVDDHSVVLMGLRTLFARSPNVILVGEATTAEGAVAEAIRKRPDVVLMDVRLPDGSGVDACREIRAALPLTRVLMLSSFPDDETVLDSILAGCAGYLLKQTGPGQLLQAVEQVATGRSLLDPEVTECVLRWIRRTGRRQGRPAVSQLSEQERQVLALIAEGRTNREIAARKGVSEHTIRTQVSNILRKLQVDRRAQAAALVNRQGADRR